MSHKLFSAFSLNETVHMPETFECDINEDSSSYITLPDDFMENRSVPSRSVSRLSYSSCGSGGATSARMCSSFLPELDGSEPEDNFCQQFPMYQSHEEGSSHTSEESLSAAPQVWVSLINSKILLVEENLSKRIFIAYF